MTQIVVNTTYPLSLSHPKNASRREVPHATFENYSSFLAATHWAKHWYLQSSVPQKDTPPHQFWFSIQGKLGVGAGAGRKARAARTARPTEITASTK